MAGRVSSGGVISVTGNTLENTDTSSQYSGIKDLEFILLTLEPTLGQITRSLVSRCRTIPLRILVEVGRFILMAVIKRSRRRSRAIRSPVATIEGCITNLQGTSITGNTVTGSTDAGVYLENAVPSAFKDNVITGNGTTTNQPGLYISHSNAELSESFLIKDNDLIGQPYWD